MAGRDGVTARRIPLTVIGGYLGVGKTTLINRLLATTDGTRFAVLVNDLGAVDVDATLLAERDADRIVLSNGCLCCSLADGLTEVMFELAERTDEFDHVVIELSGVGLPGPVARWGRAPGFVPGATLVLAAADSVVGRLADPLVGDTVARQLADADLVALTRTDLADPETIEAAAAAIAEQTAAPIAPGSSTELPWSTIVSAEVAGASPDGAAPAGASLDGASQRDGHGADPGFAARAVDVTGWTLDRLRWWLDHRPADIWRAKGVVELAEGTRVVQVVGRRVEVTDAGDGLSSGPLVVIAPTAAMGELDPWIDLGAGPTA